MEYKIPFRQVYCATFSQWVLEMIWIFFVIKFFPGACDFGANFEWEKSTTCPYCNSHIERHPIKEEE